MADRSDLRPRRARSPDFRRNHHVVLAYDVGMMRRAGRMRSTNTHRRAIHRRRRRRFAVVILLLIGGGAWLWWAINEPPAWWQPPDPTSEPVIDLGHSTENFIITQVHEVRAEEEDWRFRLRNDQMNAWFAVNLPAWFENQVGRPWPGNVSLPLVSASPRGLRMGFVLPDRFGQRIIAVRIMPRISDGQLRLPLKGVAVGKAPLPAAGAVLSLLREQFRYELPGETLDIIGALLSGDAALTPILELSDGRVVELRDITLESDAIVFTCRTYRERRKTDPAGDEAKSTGDHP